MIEENGRKLFGFFTDAYDETVVEPFAKYLAYRNNISKTELVHYINHLNCAYTSGKSYDIFTGELITQMGLFVDGCFVFPTEFPYYLEHYDIGIPPEYEQYLIETFGLK